MPITTMASLRTKGASDLKCGDTNGSFLVTKISPGCNFEIALRLSTHFVPFYKWYEKLQGWLFFLVIHLSPSHLASGTSTSVAKQRCSGGVMVHV